MSKKSYVIVSRLIDTMIKDIIVDVDITMFTSIQELLEYTDSSPIRADKLYITGDILKDNTRNSMQTIIDLMRTPMCKVDKVYYITDKASKEVSVIDYILSDSKIDNWELIQGKLNREYVTNIICGDAQDNEDTSPLHKRAIYKIKKEDYIESKLRHPEVLDNHYESEEEVLSKIDDVPKIDYKPLDVATKCKVVNVAGLPFKERTIFAFLLAQYTSFTDKTFIMESDFEFLTLSDIVARATKMKMFVVDVDDFYDDYSGVINAIKTAPENLIVMKASHREKINYDFIFNVIYANLSDSFNYMIKECDVSEIVSSKVYNIVMPNNTVDILKTIDSLPTLFSKDNQCVGVQTTTINELGIKDVNVLNSLLCKILSSEKKLNCSIVSVTSLMLGGETHDLCMYIR